MEEISRTIVFTALGAILSAAGIGIGIAVSSSQSLRVIAAATVALICSYAFGVGIRALVGA